MASTPPMLSALLLAVGLVACAAAPKPAPEPAPPPPPLPAERLDAARARAPGIAAQAELLQWEAEAHAERGDVAAAGRAARLARQVLESAHAIPERSCASAPTETSTRTSEAPAPPEPKRRAGRRAARRRAKAPAPPKVDPLAKRLRALAAALSGYDAERLTPAQRVWLENGRRALLEAQRAQTAGDPARATERLEVVDESLAALRASPAAPAGPAGTSTGAADLDTLDALSRDLAAEGLATPKRAGAWLIVELPGGPQGAVTAEQRARLQAVGRLLRAHRGVQVTVGAPAEAAAEPVGRFLEVVERLDPARFVEPPPLDVDAPLWIGLTLARTAAAG